MARRSIAVGVLLLLGAAAVLFGLSPRQQDKPVLIVYAPKACVECARWIEYLEKRGFRTIKRTHFDSDARQAQRAIPPTFSAPVLARAGNRVIQGFVPAREIHRLVEGHLGDSVIGLVVPGSPKGAPGVSAVQAEPYAVYAVMSHGLLRPITEYNAPPHSVTHASSWP